MYPIGRGEQQPPQMNPQGPLGMISSSSFLEDKASSQQVYVPPQTMEAEGQEDEAFSILRDIEKMTA